MATIVRLGPEYFPDPTKGKPISSGDLYIGIPDLDPEIVANQIQVTAVQESGDSVSISQPISTSSGGVPLYNGSPVTLTVNTSYSLKLLDSFGSQVYYTPNSFVQGSSKEILYLSDFDCDFSSAISTIGSTVTTLVIDCDAIIADGTTETTPGNISIEVIKGGSFDGVSGGGTETLNINGSFTSGIYQVFGTNLTVNLGIGSTVNVYPEWWAENTTPGTTDMTSSVTNALTLAPTGSTVYFQGYTYVFSPQAEVTVERSINMTMAPGGSFDAQSAADDLWVIHMEGSTENTLPLGADAAENDKTITVNATLAATLEPGDLIYIDSDDLWSTSFQKGEFCEVLSVSGTTVTLFHTLNDSYVAANTDVMKVLPVTGNITGLNIIATRTKNNIGFAFTYGRGINIEGGSTLGAEQTGLYTNFCYDTSINRFNTNDSNGASIGTNYGISVNSSQYTIIDGCIANGGRHGINAGGNRPIRYTTIKNNVVSSEGNNVYSLNFHKNAQYAKVENNTITDKAKLQGYDISVIGNDFTDTAGTNGSLFYNAEEGRECKYLIIKDNTFKAAVQYSINIVIPTDGIDSLVISDNEPMGPILFDTTSAAAVAINNLRIDKNNIESSTSFIGIHISGDDLTASIDITNFRLEGNTSVIDNIFAFLTYTNVTKLFVRDNDHTATGGGSSDYLVYNTFSTIENIYIHGNYANSSTGSSAFRVEATDFIECINNHIDGYLTNGVRLTADNILFANNQHPQRFLTMVLTGRFYDSIFGRGNVSTWGSGPPTTEAWEKGDVSTNSGPQAATTPGWVCITSGTPGTWKARAVLDA